MGWLVPDIDRGAEAALAAAGPAEPRHEETPDSTFYVALRGILRLVPYVHWLVILAAFLATKLGRVMPTALDNGQRSPRKLLAAVVCRLVLCLKR